MEEQDGQAVTLNVHGHAASPHREILGLAGAHGGPGAEQSRNGARHVDGVSLPVDACDEKVALGDHGVALGMSSSLPERERGVHEMGQVGLDRHDIAGLRVLIPIHGGLADREGYPRVA